MKFYRKNVVAITTFLCLGVLFYGIPSAWGQSAHTAKLIEGAKNEGKLVWYTSMNISDSRRLLDVFEKKYPFVKSQLLRANGERTVNRILAETRAGKWGYDVVSTSGIRINVLAQRGLVSSYASPEAMTYREEFKDSANFWIAMNNTYLVLCYNTTLVTEAEAPKNWEDLLDPKWKGKIAIDQRDFPWYVALLKTWGKEKAQKYIQALSRQRIQWRTGHTLMAQLTAAGEFPMSLTYSHRIESMKKKGAPIEWVHTLDPVVVILRAIGLSAKPVNTNTAKLFIDFVLSKEGQEMILSFNRNPARPDIGIPSPKIDPAKLKVVAQDIGMRYNEYAQEFRRLFGR